jgi:hypothetical protein
MSAGSTQPDAPSPGAPQTLDHALQRFRDVLTADGYDLRWSVTAQDRVVVEIQAGPEACADCLVPLPVMEAIMSDALAPTRYELDHIVLPATG